MNQRSFKLKGGNLVHFKQYPRYGGWTVNFDKGGIPQALSGRWLDFDDLFAKTNHYLKHRKDFKTEILDEVERPEPVVEYTRPEKRLAKYRDKAKTEAQESLPASAE